MEFLHKGRTIKYSLENKAQGVYFEFEHDSLVYRYFVKYGLPDNDLRIIRVAYYLQLFTPSGNVVQGYENPQVVEYLETDYDRFAAMEGLSTLFDTIYMHMLNGLIYRAIDPATGKQFGVRPYKEDGTNYQPTVFDAEVTKGATSKDIAITQYESAGAVEYSLDGQTWQSGLTFTGVPLEAKRLISRDSEANYNVAEV